MLFPTDAAFDDAAAAAGDAHAGRCTNEDGKR